MFNKQKTYPDCRLRYQVHSLITAVQTLDANGITCNISNDALTIFIYVSERLSPYLLNKHYFHFKVKEKL